MSGSLANRAKGYVKARKTPLARAIYRLVYGIRHFNVPVIPGVHSVLYSLHYGVTETWHNLTRIFWFTPLFKSRLVSGGADLSLEDGMPYIAGTLRIWIGTGCRISGKTNLNGYNNPNRIPELHIGDNVSLSFQSSISVGTTVRIGDNCQIAPGCYLAGYPGHPIDAEARARMETSTEDQAGDIVLEDDVWLGTRVIVSPNVHIGRGTIVAAGSVVTKDLPPFVLAGGMPAKVIRKLPHPVEDATSTTASEELRPRDQKKKALAMSEVS